MLMFTYRLTGIGATLVREAWALYPRRVIAVVLALALIGAVASAFHVNLFPRDGEPLFVMPGTEVSAVPRIGDPCTGEVGVTITPGPFTAGSTPRPYTGHLGINVFGYGACLVDDSWRGHAGEPLNTMSP